MTYPLGMKFTVQCDWQNELVGWDDEHDSFFLGGWYLFSCAPLTVMPHPACILFAGFCLCIFPCLWACFFCRFFLLLLTSFCLFGFFARFFLRLSLDRLPNCPPNFCFSLLCFFFFLAFAVMPHPACILFAGFCLCIFPCLCACFFVGFFFVIYQLLFVWFFARFFLDYRSTACPTAHLIFVFLCFFFWFLLLLLCHTLHACFLFAGFCLCIFSCLCACFFAAFFLLFTSFCLFGFLHAFFKTIARPPAQLPT